MFDLIFLGDPASGKATQSKRICKKYRMYDLDMGKELRALKKTGSKQTKEILKQTLDKGKLTPTKLVRKILKDRINSLPKNKSILFDGTPKMLGEAELIYKNLKKARSKDKILVLYVRIPKKEILKRMLLRKRSDDTMASLQNRIKYYHLNIAEVIKFFRKKYKFKYINGLGSRAEVYKRIEKQIHAFNDKN